MDTVKKSAGTGVRYLGIRRIDVNIQRYLESIRTS